MNHETHFTCYVASLKYSPVMWNIGQAVGEPVRDKGNSVRYLLTESYQWLTANQHGVVDLVPSVQSLRVFNVLQSKRIINRISCYFHRWPPGLLVLINQNPLLDRVLISLAKEANPNVRVISLVHEPYTAHKMVYGLKRSLLLVLYEILNGLTIAKSHGVILPSPNAMQAFNHRYRNFGGGARLIPLPFVDKACRLEMERRYVTFLGHVRHEYQKGVDLFFEMVEASHRRGYGLEFQIISANDVTSLIRDLSSGARETLRVISGDRLRDEDISRALRQSVVVMLLQRRVMQSGVLPMAYMNGTPVIVSDLLGFTQFVDHSRTGWVLPMEPSLQERFEAIRSVQEQLDVMSSSCRQYYLETFDSRQVEKHVAWLLGDEV